MDRINFADSHLKTYAAFTIGSSGMLYLLYRSMYLNSQGSASRTEKTENGVFNYKTLGFVPDGQKEIYYTQPKNWVGKKCKEAFYALMGYMFSPKHSIDFINARKVDVDYEKTGFTLTNCPVEECDWHVRENRDKFYKAMEPFIRKLHPNAETVHWIDEAFLARNCEDGNPPAIDGPHVDYYVDQSIVKPFAGYDLSAYDIVIGLWKPENMSNPVVDYPLAVMDGSTLDEDCVIPVFGEITQTTIGKENQTIKFVSGALKYADKQKWFYYPEQTVDEVLVFRHYTNEKNGKPFACGHTSFQEPNSQKTFQSRRSIETRVGIILKK